MNVGDDPIGNKKSRIYGTSDSFAKINLICQICQRVRSVRESDLWGRSVRPCDKSESPKWEAVTHTASQNWESDRPLTHTGRCCHPRGRLTDFTAKRIASAGRVRSPARCAWEADRTLKSVRPCAWEAVLSSEANQTLKSVRPIGLSDRSHDFRTPTASQIWESDRPLTHTDRTTPAESPILGAIWLISRLNALLRPVESDRCAWEADRTLKSVRPIGTSDSHGLTDLRGRVRERLCSPDWLRQITWQIVRGRERPWGSDWLQRSGTLWHRSLSQWEPHGLTRPLTASQIRPLKHIKYTESLTFDSNSTSDRSLSDVLKTQPDLWTSRLNLAVCFHITV